MTDSLLFQIQMSEHNLLLCGGELHDNLSQPTFLHIIPSWQSTMSMQQIGSLIYNEHDKMMVKNDNSVLTLIYYSCVTIANSQNVVHFVGGK